MRILFDWLTFTSKIDSVDSIIEYLGLTNVTWLNQNGNYGYKDRLYFGNISILYNGSDNMGICVDMSGKGCRAYETFGNGNWNNLFELLIESPDDYNITRLDVAYDDLAETEKDEYTLSIKNICNDTKEYNYISKFRTHKVVYGTDGDSVEFGSRQSDVLIRIYDKLAEQKSKGIDISYYRWVRVEIQMRRERASVFLNEYCKNYNDIGQLYSGVIYNYLRFIIPDSNIRKDRCTMRDYWNKFLDNAQKIHIFTRVLSNYNILNLEQYVINQAGGAVDTYIKIVGLDKFSENIKKRLSKPNIKYKKLLNEFGC